MTFPSWVRIPAFLVGFGVGCWAQPAPVSVTWELIDQSVTLHEPILMRLIVENQSGAADVAFDLGANGKEGLSFVITKPDGSKDERPSLDPFGPGSAGGLSTSGRVEIAPGGRYTRDYVVNEWYRFDTPGEYGIEVRLRPPIMAGAQPIEADASASFRCAIAARDENALRNRSGSLVDRIFAAHGNSGAEQLALELSYVTDPVVVPYLKEVLASQLGMARYVAIKALGTFPTVEAVKALIPVVQTPGPDRALAAGTLAMLATKIEDAVLRQRIRDALDAARR
jgi:hypothetical protein